MRFTAPQRKLLREYKFSDRCPKCGENSLNLSGTACSNVRCPEPAVARVKPRLLFYCNDCMGPKGGGFCGAAKYGNGQSLTWGEALNAAKHAHGERGIQILVQYPDSAPSMARHSHEVSDVVFNFTYDAHHGMHHKQFSRAGVFTGCYPDLSSPVRPGLDSVPLRVEQFVDRVDALPPFPRVSDNLQFWGDLFRDILETSVNPI